MQLDQTRQPLSRVARAALALEVLLSIGALGGGLVLMLAPRGEILPLPLAALAGSPFDTYFVPGLILFGVLGLGPLIAARLALLRHPLAATAAFIVGAGLLIWVGVEVAIIGYSNEPPLQAIYGILGVVILFVAVRWLLDLGLPQLTATWRRMADLDVGWLNWPGEWASNEARVQAQSAFAWSYADWGHVTPDLGALASLEKT